MSDHMNANETVPLSAEEFETLLSQYLSELTSEYMASESNTDMAEGSLKAMVAMGQRAQAVLNRDYRVSGFGQARTVKEVSQAMGGGRVA
jgi:hypothetical protein